MVKESNDRSLNCYPSAGVMDLVILIPRLTKGGWVSAVFIDSEVLNLYIENQQRVK